MSSKNNPKITVVTVTYNCAGVLQATIDSVAEQTYRHLEYIVVDGGSTDGTLDIIRANADKITRWISEPDKGIYDAMNKGIAMASGDYINFMNAGDIFCSNTSVKDFVSKIDPNSQIVYGVTIMKTSDISYELRPLALEQIKFGMVFGHPSTFVKRELMQQNPFDTTFRIAADYNFFMQAYLKGIAFQYIPLNIAVFDAQGGISSNNYRLVQYENGRVQGRTESISWIIWHNFDVARHFTKQWSKKILPTCVVNTIKQTNLKKLKQR